MCGHDTLARFGATMSMHLYLALTRFEDGKTKLSKRNTIHRQQRASETTSTLCGLFFYDYRIFLTNETILSE